MIAGRGEMRNRSPRRPRSNPSVLQDTMELVWEFSPPVTDEEPGQEVQAPQIREQDWQRMRVSIALEIEAAFTTSRVAGGTRVGDYMYDFSKNEADKPNHRNSETHPSANRGPLKRSTCKSGFISKYL